MVYRRKNPEQIHQVVSYLDADEKQRFEDFCRVNNVSVSKGVRLALRYALIYVKDVLSKQQPKGESK